MAGGNFCRGFAAIVMICGAVSALADEALDDSTAMLKCVRIQNYYIEAAKEADEPEEQQTMQEDLDKTLMVAELLLSRAGRSQEFTDAHIAQTIEQFSAEFATVRDEGSQRYQWVAECARASNTIKKPMLEAQAELSGES